MMKDVLFLGFKNHLKCIMNTNDEILFDLILMEASSICNDCISIHIQSIGVINDKTSSFKQMRREYQKPVITKYSSQLRVISKNLISLDQVIINFFSLFFSLLLNVLIFIISKKGNER